MFPFDLDDLSMLLYQLFLTTQTSHASMTLFLEMYGSLIAPLTSGFVVSQVTVTDLLLHACMLCNAWSNSLLLLSLEYLDILHPTVLLISRCT